MKLIIDIPDEVYDWHVNGFPDEEDAVRLLDIVKNGTPLSESEDCVSRQAVLEKIHEAPYINDCSNIGMLLEAWINSIPSVKPQYTDAEIQKMQDLEFAEIQKAYEIGKAEGSEVLDEIRAEIDAQIIPRSSYTDKQKKQVLEIIDKYREPTVAESEGGTQHERP